jgi:shikimate dehydrogenase
MIVRLDGETRLYPIIGDPIRYLRSPELLSRSFAARGHNGICIPLQVSEGGFSDVMGSLALISNVDGLLVTMPHKFAAYGHCATVSETSRLLKTISVMRRNRDGSWHGDMLDGKAFLKAQVDAGARPAGGRVLLVGAGGAGRAIAIAMLSAGVRELVVHDRSETRAGELVGLLADVGGRRVATGPADPSGFDMVCNATPMGMANGDPMPVSTDLIAPSAFVGDVIAGHGETAFLRAARVRGCKTASGDQMVAAVQEMMVDFLLSR